MLSSKECQAKVEFFQKTILKIKAKLKLKFDEWEQYLRQNDENLKRQVLEKIQDLLNLTKTWMDDKCLKFRDVSIKKIEILQSSLESQFPTNVVEDMSVLFESIEFQGEHLLSQYSELTILKNHNWRNIEITNEQLQQLSRNPTNKVTPPRSHRRRSGSNKFSPSSSSSASSSFYSPSPTPVKTSGLTSASTVSPSSSSSPLSGPVTFPSLFASPLSGGSSSTFSSPLSSNSNPLSFDSFSNSSSMSMHSNSAGMSTKKRGLTDPSKKSAHHSSNSGRRKSSNNSGSVDNFLGQYKRITPKNTNFNRHHKQSPGDEFR